MSIEEVLDRDIETIIRVNGGISENVLVWRHELLAVFVTKSSDMIPHASSSELLVKRDLLQLHAVDASSGRPEQRRGCDKRRLHLDVRVTVKKMTARIR